MAQCKYCKKEVVWVVKEDGKNRPYNAQDLTPHDCPEGQAARGNNKGGGYSGPRSDPVVIARQSSLKVAADVYLKGLNGGTPDYDKDLKEVIRGAAILTEYVTTGKVPE